MALAPGMAVTDNVRLVRLLGEGGMGSVWVAEHRALNTEVAVKFVSADLIAEDPSILERFNREASLAAQIKSPFVVQIYDHGVMDDGRPYMVMELLEGESLADRQRQGPLPLDLTGKIVSQAAKALSKAHRLGIVHRDIKPDNLFLTYEDGELFLKVLDFGIAKQTGLPQAKSVTSTGMMVGTPEYMSPEQVLSAKDVDAQADLWALGVVAYHCLTGEVPFTGETLGAVCVAIAQSQAAPVTRARPELPAAVDHWFERALAKDPSQRFAHAKALSVAFERALRGERFDDIVVPDPRTALTSEPDWSGGHLALGSLSGASQLTPGVAASVTFAGTTRSAGRGHDKRRSILLVAGLLALGAAGVTAVALTGGEPDGARAPAETGHQTSPPSSHEASAPAAEPAPPPSSRPEPRPEPDPSATPEPSATAQASSKPLATSTPTQATSNRGHATLPAPKPTTQPKPKSTTVDRGF